jgi:CHAT domain-containing protein
VRGCAPRDALADAQRWLREATAAELHRWAVGSVRALPRRERRTAKRTVAALDRFVPSSRPFASPVYWGAFQFVGADGPGDRARRL